MDDLYIVMPAYNEEANIESVISAWYPVLEGKGEGSRLVVADSGSVDKTHEILLSLKEKSSEEGFQSRSQMIFGDAGVMRH